MRRAAAVLLVVASLALASACGSDQDTDALPPTTTEDNSDALVRTHVQVFFVRGEDVATGGVDAVGPTIPRQAMQALLAGPAGEDSVAGLGTQIPDGTTLNDLRIADGTATVDLSSSFTSGGGSLSMQLRVAQVVFTLTQFDEVTSVAFLIDGAEVDGLGGEGLPTTYEGREAFADVTPAILPTSPTPGQAFSEPISVEGTMATSVTTLQWTLRTTEGQLLDEGTVEPGPATDGRVPFELEADGNDSVGGAVLTFWQDSPEGDRADSYEVRVTLE